MTSTDPEGDARRLCDEMRRLDWRPDADEAADAAAMRLSQLLAEGAATPSRVVRVGPAFAMIRWGRGDGAVALHVGYGGEAMLSAWSPGPAEARADLDLDHPGDRAEVVAASLAAWPKGDAE